jgi:hypothetical protein
MGVEPTQDESIAPQTVLKTAAVTGPRAAPLRILPRDGRAGHPPTAAPAGSRRRRRSHSSSAAPLRRLETSIATATIATIATAPMTAIVSPLRPLPAASPTAAFGFRSR